MKLTSKFRNCLFFLTLLGESNRDIVKMYLKEEDKMISKFPSDFLWGASTSAFQVEGAYLSDGKGLATVDVRDVPEGKADTKIASDHYNHYKEDIQLMKQLGIGVYRFSFSWSRIMPDGQSVNQKGLDFYHRLIDECLNQGIIPFPTLYHFEMPMALVDDFGGWISRDCVTAFVNYAKICFQTFKNKVTMWGTINEQLIASAAPDLNGNHEKDAFIRERNMYQMSYHMSLAEKLAISEFRDIVPNGQIGPICSMQVVYPETSSPSDILAASDASDFLQNMLLDMSVTGVYPLRVQKYFEENGLTPIMNDHDEFIMKSNSPDFIGVNYYSSTCVRSKDFSDDRKMPPFFRSTLYTLGDNKHLEKTEWMEFGIDSLGLYTGIRSMYERYKLPMIITENGFAYSDELVNGQVHDDYRIEYIREHIKQCYEIVSDGYPLLGYCPWSLLDIVSSHQGFSKRYGLIYVDRTDTDIKSCKRIPKKSYYWYQQVIRDNGIKQELVEENTYE